MRITRIEATEMPPIRAFKIVGLSNPVIVAGANGSGKTRLKEAIAATFRKPDAPQVSLTISATRSEESQAWGTETLDVVRGANCAPLATYMGTRHSGGTHVGTVVQIDSDRSVTPVKFQPITLSTPDPHDAPMGLAYYLSPFGTRWPELVNRIHQKVASRDLKIAAAARARPTATGQSYLDSNPDPFVQYQEVFRQLLPGKSLEPIDPKNPREFHYRIGTAGPFEFRTLSSGEQEVVKVAFDLIWKQIRHSVILIDEPELHLHPTLAFRLVETLKLLGGGTNQLVLFTHSSDLLSTYFATGNVYFIDLDASIENQARRLSDLQSDHVATARTVGANLGLFAVGKKLIFVEGTEASVDRLTYHKVAQECFPDAYLLPTGSVRNISALQDVSAELSKAIFGVDLFMIRDRDGLTDEQVSVLESNPRFRVLPRRHVENFFLDADVLQKVADRFYLSASLQDRASIETALIEAAKTCLNKAIIGDIKQLLTMDGSIHVPKFKGAEELDLEALAQRVSVELGGSVVSLAQRLSETSLKSLVRARHAHLTAALGNGTWKVVFPGKAVLAQFVGAYWRMDLARVRQAYVDVALAEKPQALQEIRGILEGFRSLA